MSENIFYPKDGTNPFVKNLDEYKKLYKQSIDNPKDFFGKLARENIQWIEDFDSVHNGEFAETKWFEGGKTNISVNCCLLYTSPSPRDQRGSRMPSSA